MDNTILTMAALGNSQEALLNCQQITQNIATVTTSSQTVDASVASVPSTVLAAPAASFVESGQTLVNLVTNGDFSAGTTGWTQENGATLSVMNGVLSCVSNGTNTYTGAATTAIRSTAGDKVFCFARMRVTNSDATNGLRLYVGGTALAIEPSPVANKWYDIFGTHTVAATGLLTLAFRQGYASAAASNGKEAQVDDYMTINMTALGLTALTGEQMANLCRTGYFSGMASAGAHTVRATGKNLYDGVLAVGSIDTSTGADSVSTTEIRSTNYIPVKPSTQYVLSDDLSLTGRVFQYDTTMKLISYADSEAFTTASNCAYVRFRYVSTNLSAKIQLELGTTATSYEPYTDTLTTIDTPLRRVPNGTCDTLDLATGQKVQRVQEYTLVAGDISLYTGYTNFDVVQILKPADAVSYNNTTAFSGVNYPPFKTIAYTDDLATNIGLIRETGSATKFEAGVAKGTYANLAAAQAALSGTKIQYQLATPVVTEIDSLAIPIIRPYGQIVTTPGTGTVLPSIAYTAPTSVQGQIQTLTNAVAELYDAVESILAAIV